MWKESNLDIKHYNQRDTHKWLTANPPNEKNICLVNRHSPGIGLILLCSPLCSIHHGAIDLKRQKVDDYISKKENVTSREKEPATRKF